MAVIRLSRFAGQVPKLDRHVLPDPNATQAVNVDLRSGVLSPVRQAKRILAWGSSEMKGYLIKSAQRIFRMARTDDGAIYWMMFPDPFAHIERNPALNVALDTVFFTSSGNNLRFAEENDLYTNGNSAVIYDAGVVPGPSFTVTTSGGTGTNVTRSYVAVYALLSGEQGVPSTAVIAVGKPDGTWTIANYPTTKPQDNYNRIQWYRGTEADGTYRLVGQLNLPTGTTSFNDTVTESELVTQPALETFDDDPPPDNLQGLVQHPGGFLAGFVERDVFMSKPYLPHSWPISSSIRVRSKIVALVVVGESIVVLTEGVPSILTGTSPDLMQKQDYTTPMPCIARRSAIVYKGAVYYATSDGLARMSYGGPEVVTSSVIDREDWRHDWLTTDTEAVLWDGTYLALTSASTGLIFALEQPEFGLVRLSFTQAFNTIAQGPDTSDVLFYRNGDIEQWMPDEENTPTLRMVWSSKVFYLHKPMNLGAFQIKRSDEAVEVPENPLLAVYLDYNTMRLSEGPLDVLNGYPINGEIYLPTEDQLVGKDLPPVQPLGGEPLYDTSILSSDSIRVRIIADGNIMFDAPVNAETTYRTRHGYKGTRWSVEIISYVSITAIHLAGTPQELARA